VLPPTRTCIGCRRKAAVGELTRLVCDPAGWVVPGSGRPGRGAWVCTGSLQCLSLARRRHGFQRAFRKQVLEASLDRLPRLLGWERPEPKADAMSGARSGEVR
jgi:predicted RNA-binding protein YlxR (DUF448 family)